MVLSIERDVLPAEDAHHDLAPAAPEPDVGVTLTKWMRGARAIPWSNVTVVDVVETWPAFRVTYPEFPRIVQSVAHI